MRGFLLLGLGAFAAGAAAAVAQQRRLRVADDFGEDPNWPAVPYTAETHPDSPQEQVTAPVQTPPSEPMVETPATAATSGGQSQSGSAGAGTSSSSATASGGSSSSGTRGDSTSGGSGSARPAR